MRDQTDTQADSMDFVPGLERCFSTPIREMSYAIRHIDGVLPAFLRGSYYLNGPANFRRGHVVYKNWLDGDGMVCALRFENGQVVFTSRYVRGEKFLTEESQQSARYATFGTRFDGDRLRRGVATECPYNVSVYPYGERLLAFGEQSIPMAIDPRSLDTLEPCDFGRQLNEMSPFSAHPKFDNGQLFNFGISFSASQPCLNYYRFDANESLACRKRVPLSYPCSLHDFAISQHYAIFYLSPYLLDVRAVTRSGKSTLDALAWKPELGSQLMVLDRNNGQTIAQIDLPPRYCLHTIAAREQHHGVTLDVLELDRPVYGQYQLGARFFHEMPAATPVRYEVDLANQRIDDRHEIDRVHAIDFPATLPGHDRRSADMCWMLGSTWLGTPGRKFFNSLLRVEWATSHVDQFTATGGWLLGGEPVIVPARESSEAAVICQMLNPRQHQYEFVVFDAFQIAAGPRCRLRLDAPIHVGFHAAFAPA